MPAAEREHAESSSLGEPAGWRGSLGMRLAGLAAALVAVAVVAVFVAGRAEHGKPSATADSPSPGGDLHSIFVSGGNLCVGGHSTVALSHDAGRTLPRVRSFDDADARGWAATGATVLVGGHAGLFRSTDDGVSFRIVSGQGALGDVHALGGAGATVYAASPNVGLLASTDGARRWQPRNSHIGPSFMGAILVDAASPTRLDGLYRAETHRMFPVWPRE